MAGRPGGRRPPSPRSLAGLGLRLVERRAARRARRRERSRYLAHLDQVAVQADQLAAAQLAVAEHLHPDLPTLWATIDRTDRLWERRPGDADFLTVRVGRGPVPLATPARLDTAGGPLAEHDPELLEAAEDLVRRAGWLPDAPVTVPSASSPSSPSPAHRPGPAPSPAPWSASSPPSTLPTTSESSPPTRLRPPLGLDAMAAPHPRPDRRDPRPAPTGHRPLLADAQARPRRPHLLAILDTTEGSRPGRP